MKDLIYIEVVDEYTGKMEDEANGREVQDENDREYIVQTARVEFLRDLILGEENRIRIKSLINFRVLKFPGIIQNTLYLLDRDYHINLPGTNTLNWPVVKNLINDKDFFEGIKNYEWVGPKGKVPF